MGFHIHWCEVFMLGPIGLGIGVLLCSVFMSKANKPRKPSNDGDDARASITQRSAAASLPRIIQ